MIAPTDKIGVEQILHQEEYLLDNPPAEMLDKHRRIVEREIALGKLISLTTEHPHFPDKETRKQVAATMSILQRQNFTPAAFFLGLKCDLVRLRRISMVCSAHETR